jgi:hypothetical protein
MKTRTNFARHLLANFTAAVRFTRLANLHLVLAGFGLPVCEGSISKPRFKAGNSPAMETRKSP